MRTAITALIGIVFILGFQNASAHHFDYVGKQFDSKLENGQILHIEFDSEPIYSLYSHDPVIIRGEIIGSNEIVLDDMVVKSYSNSFVFSNPSEGWYIFGKKIKSEDYSISLNEWNGKQFLKTQFISKLSDIKTEQPTPISNEKIIEKSFAGILPKKDLIVLTKQTLRNYWNDNYQIFVKVFDKKLNPNPDFDSFTGAVNNADISVSLALQDGSNKKTLTGKTQNGLWQGKQYFSENISPSGKYLVNVVAKDGDSTASQNLEMFLFATVLNPSSSNHAPIANAGADQNKGTSAAATLDGSASSDPDGDTLTYSWVQTSGTAVVLNDATATSPTFTTPNAASTLVFELTVSDGRATNTDSVTINVS